MESFYVILPSNSGTDVSQISTSNYSVRLPSTLDLSEGEWTVALSSIIYPVTFHSEEEEMVIILNYSDGSKRIINIPQKAYTSVQEMESILNEIILGEKIEIQENIVEKRSVSLNLTDEEAHDLEKRQAEKTPDQLLNAALKEIKIYSNEKREKLIQNLTVLFNESYLKIDKGIENAQTLHKYMYNYGGLAIPNISQLDNQLKSIHNNLEQLKFVILAGTEKKVKELQNSYLQLIEDIDPLIENKDVKKARDLANQAKSLINELKILFENSIPKELESLKRYEMDLEDIEYYLRDIITPVNVQTIESFKRIISNIAVKFKSRHSETGEVHKGSEKKHDMDKIDVYLYYDKVSGRFFLFNNKPNKIIGVQMSKSLAFRLGFEVDNHSHVKNIHLSRGGGFAKYVPYTGKGVPQFFVYMPNIIEDSFIGNALAPVLRVINVDKIPGTYAENIYNLEYHHKIIQKRISTITIQLRDLGGDFLRFDWGDVIVILHFKKNYYI